MKVFCPAAVGKSYEALFKGHLKDIIKPGPVLKEELTRLNAVYDEFLAGFDLGGQEKLNREDDDFVDIILLLHASYAQAGAIVLIEESISNSKNIEDINSMIPGQSMVKSQISQHTLLSKLSKPCKFLTFNLRHNCDVLGSYYNLPGEFI